MRYLCRGIYLQLPRYHRVRQQLIEALLGKCEDRRPLMPHSGIQLQILRYEATHPNEGYGVYYGCAQYRRLYLKPYGWGLNSSIRHTLLIEIRERVRYHNF